MTSNVQSSELIESGRSVRSASSSFLTRCIDTEHFIGREHGRKRRDTGLWLLQREDIRQARWLAMKQEYQLSTPLIDAQRRGYAVLRRLCDIAGSLIFLAIFTPVLLLVAACVRIDSPGPALFRQWRVGRNGRRFKIWKLRTMHGGAAAYARSPRSVRDSRVTRIGRFLRRTSMDELPQLVNVLRGDMSLIGPRPEMPFIAGRYTRRERQRLIVRPGMTGLWQIGPARTEPIHHNLHCDLHYIRNRNLLMDAAILLRTAIVVVSGNGPC